MEHRHVLLVTFPAQGHINPALQFAERLIHLGIEVTFATSLYARRRMPAAAKGLNFSSFSDGYDDGFKISKGDDPNQYMVEIRSRGSKSLKDTIAAAADRGRPITCLVYTLLLPWAPEVARECHVPSALLWIQPAAVLAIYYYYFNGYGDRIETISDEEEIQMPGLPLLSKRDLPSFILPSSSDTYSFALAAFKEQLEKLDAETKPRVLVNTYSALEPDALEAVHKYEMVAVGPLIPPAFLDGKDPSDNSFAGDLFKKDDDYMEWLNTKADSSVVYVSFGSLLRSPKPEMEEIAAALVSAGRPFIWVIRADEEEAEEEKMSWLEEVEKLGKIVAWCSQLEVLTHPALGCFVTHCGWNSTLESLSCGVPVVAYPHWTDQGTNAKLIEEAWRTGVRVRENGEGKVERGEIKRCIEEVMNGGEKSRELRLNAQKWRGLAREAVGENGSSTKNLHKFLEEIQIN